MYYIVDAGIDHDLICLRLLKASQFYTHDSQTLYYNKFKKKNNNNNNNIHINAVFINTVIRS